MRKNDLSEAFLALNALVARLRGPGGCPWDAQQTYETIKTYLLEEAYEVLDAIEQGSPEDLCHEMGDLLFQLLFLAGIAADRGEFDLQDIIEAITEKMIRRHPHVFGGKRVAGPEEVAENWEKIKRQENCSAETSSSLLRRVPSNLPALMRATRLSQRALRLCPAASQPEEIWPGVEERFEGLKKRFLEGDREGIGEKAGDLLFALVNLTRSWELNAEHLLRAANQKFIECFEKGEETIEP
ncbi:MAG: nucleoside triphosphate pyrophosphohydrolase [Proteobacteria bacterium]|nr:nucleoside triphosphate pyrophosphohydrolase [Pseudomonadota bacterium]